MLGDLLDRFEAGTASPIAHPDYGAFASVVAADSFLKEIGRAEQAGAVSVGRGTGNENATRSFTSGLAAPEVLYRHLDRVPSSQIAEDAGRPACGRSLRWIRA